VLNGFDDPGFIMTITAQGFDPDKSSTDLETMSKTLLQLNVLLPMSKS
jgi:hypothetical protein